MDFLFFLKPTYSFHQIRKQQCLKTFLLRCPHIASIKRNEIIQNGWTLTLNYIAIKAIGEHLRDKTMGLIDKNNL